MTEKVDLKISLEALGQIEGVVILISKDLLYKFKNSDDFLWEDFFIQIGQEFDKTVWEENVNE